MKAILLIRVSTETQDLVQQREKVVDAAVRDGYTKSDLILIEDKESAVKLSEEERNGLNKLKTCILNDSSINAVYSYEISRISRQAKIVYSIRDFLIEHKVNLIILNPYFKMLKDNGELSETSNIFFGIFASMAENEGYIRKARTIRGKEKAKALGRHYTGRIPIGYKTNKDKEYVIDPETAPLVKKIFTMYTDGDMSIKKISRELQAEGIFTDCTPHTSERNIIEIIHREYYTGRVKGYPAIVTAEMYERAQEIKKRRTIETSRTPVKALLKGMMFDSISGHMLQSNTGLGSYYASNGGGVSVKMCVIEPVIWDYATELHKEYYSKDYEEAIKDITGKIQLTMRKEKTSFEKIREYEEQIERLEERIVLGKISSQKAEQLEEQIMSKLNEEKNIYEKIQSEMDRHNQQQENILDESQKQYDYNMFTLDEKIGLIKKVIEKIILERNEKKELLIEIHNNYNKDIKHIKLVRKWRNWIIG